jgi:SNF2 family DNA or RNA helicase
VLAPNDVKTNWVAWPGMLEAGEQDAIDVHMPSDVPVIKGLWISNQNAKQREWWQHFENQINQPGARDHLIVLAVNYDALNVDRLFQFLMAFTLRFKTMIAADESTEIKTPGSQRSKAAKKVRKQCHVARILTGTPIIKRPLDAYSQFDFLDEDILGYGSFYAFKNDFAVMGGFKNKQVLTYRNLDKLQELIASCSYRVTKDECFDLPPKQYQKIRVEMTPAQVKAYKQMQEEFRVDHKGEQITATIAITQVMRLAQITGGYITDRANDVEIELVKPEHNPKMQAVMRLVEEAGDQQGVVWAHFRAEIAGLARLFRKAGVKFAEFHGGISQHDRLRARKDFQAKKYDWIIANQSCAARGIDEFKGASLVAYLSNSHDTEDRIQSEDRTHRSGMQMERPCNYYDILVPNTVDVRIIQTLRGNKRLSDEIMRDGVRDWI